MILITARPYELPLTVAMQLPSILRAEGVKGQSKSHFGSDFAK